MAIAQKFQSVGNKGAAFLLSGVLAVTSMSGAFNQAHAQDAQQQPSALSALIARTNAANNNVAVKPASITQQQPSALQRIGEGATILQAADHAKHTKEATLWVAVPKDAPVTAEHVGQVYVQKLAALGVPAKAFATTMPAGSGTKVNGFLQDGLYKNEFTGSYDFDIRSFNSQIEFMAAKWHKLNPAAAVSGPAIAATDTLTVSR